STVNVVNVGSKAPTAGGIVDNIKGALTIVGTGRDTLNVDDTGSTAAKTCTLTDTTLTGLDMGPDGITYSGVSSLNIHLGSGGTTFNVQSTRAGSTRQISGGVNDTFNVSSDAATNPDKSLKNDGTLDGIAGPLIIDAGSGNASRLIVSDF